jgi:hypothetical protein
MPTLRNELDRKRLLDRLAQVTPASKPLWGRFDAPRMMCHLGDALDEALGRRVMPRLAPGVASAMLRRFPMKHLAIYVIPMPRNAKAPRELLADEPGDFEANRRRVLESIEQLTKKPSGPAPEHFLFGSMTWDRWNRLGWKHIDHHLRQFGN